MKSVRDALRKQAAICRSFGAPFYGDLLERSAEDHADGGPVARVFEGWTGDPARQALPLRLMAGVHALVLAGELPELARHYPTAGGNPRFDEAWSAFRAAVDARRDELQPWLDAPPQTNEVHRCVPLLGGFLEIARREPSPIRILEIGSSAGLNLRFDHYAYRLGEHAWGEAGAPVQLRAEWEGAPPALDAPLRVVERLGCDRRPLRADDLGDVRRLEAFVWADHAERLHVLRSALQEAARHPVTLNRMGAADWLEARLCEPDGDRVAVVFHTIVWSYLSDEEQKRVRELLEERGIRSPLHWLRLEDATENLPGLARSVGLYLTSWPGGRERRLALCQAHGMRVRWEA